MSSLLIGLLSLAAGADAPLPRGAIARTTGLAGLSTAWFCHDGEHIVVSFEDEYFWIAPSHRDRINDPDRRKEIEGRGVGSRNGKWLVVRRPDEAEILLFELPSLRRVSQVKTKGFPVAIGDDGAIILVRDGDTLLEVRSATGITDRRIDCPESHVQITHWKAGGPLIIRTGRGSSEPEVVTPILKLLGIGTASISLPEKPEVERIEECAVDLKSSMIAITYSRFRRDPLVHLYDLRTGRRLRHLHRSSYGFDHCLEFAPSSALLAVCGSVHPNSPNTPDIQAAFRFYDTKTGTQKGELVFGDDALGSIRFSPDGTRFVTVGANLEVTVWSTEMFVKSE